MARGRHASRGPGSPRLVRPGPLWMSPVGARAPSRATPPSARPCRASSWASAMLGAAGRAGSPVGGVAQQVEPAGRADARSRRPRVEPQPQAAAPRPWRPASDLGAAAATEALGGLGGALLLAHAGVDGQHRAGQGRDHPLQRRELPLRPDHPRIVRRRAEVSHSVGRAASGQVYVWSPALSPWVTAL